MQTFQAFSLLHRRRWTIHVYHSTSESFHSRRKAARGSRTSLVENWCHHFSLYKTYVKFVADVRILLWQYFVHSSSIQIFYNIFNYTGKNWDVINLANLKINIFCYAMHCFFYSKINFTQRYMYHEHKSKMFTKIIRNLKLLYQIRNIFIQYVAVCYILWTF